MLQEKSLAFIIQWINLRVVSKILNTMNEDTFFLIVNPKAGFNKGLKHWDAIKKSLEKIGIKYIHTFSEYAGHSIELARNAVVAGFRKIIAVGGDGTANEVINGIFSQDVVDTRQVQFGIIPVGTGNDWIKSHQIPNNYKKSILLLNAGKTTPHDIGKIHYHTAEGEKKTRYFLNVAGLAYDAFVTNASEKNKRAAKNRFYYLYLIFSCVTKFSPDVCRIKFNNHDMEHAFYNITIGICQYNGGGTKLVPHAIHDDGKFALTLFKDIKPIEVITKSPRFFNGSIVDHPQAFTSQTNHIQIDADKETPAYVEADGEVLGQTPIEFDMLKQSIQVFVP